MNKKLKVALLYIGLGFSVAVVVVLTILSKKNTPIEVSKVVETYTKIITETKEANREYKTKATNSVLTATKTVGDIIKDVDDITDRKEEREQKASKFFKAD